MERKYLQGVALGAAIVMGTAAVKEVADVTIRPPCSGWQCLDAALKPDVWVGPHAEREDNSPHRMQYQDVLIASGHVAASPRPQPMRYYTTGGD